MLKTTFKAFAKVSAVVWAIDGVLALMVHSPLGTLYANGVANVVVLTIKLNLLP